MDYTHRYDNPPFGEFLPTPQKFPCAIHLTSRQGVPTKSRTYLLQDWEDLYRMSLWVMDYMGSNLEVPPTHDYYGLPDEATGSYLEDTNAGVIDRVFYNRFQAIRQSRHGAKAWWWLQWNHGLLETWDISFSSGEGHENADPVPTDPPPSPIFWLTTT